MSTISDDKHFYARTEQSAKLNPGTDQRIHVNIAYYITYVLWTQAQKIFSCIARSYWIPC